MNRAIFLDRDGVLNRNVWNPQTSAFESPLNVDEFDLIPGVIPALRQFHKSGFLLFLVSNQPNYAKSKSTMECLESIHARFHRTLVAAGVCFSAYFYCYHHPAFTGPCMCRKPSPYFLLSARDRFGLAMEHSWMIGDRETDVECGRRAGVRTVAISSREHLFPQADLVACDLWSAAQKLVGA